MYIVPNIFSILGNHISRVQMILQTLNMAKKIGFQVGFQRWIQPLFWFLAFLSEDDLGESTFLTLTRWSSYPKNYTVVNPRTRRKPENFGWYILWMVMSWTKYPYFVVEVQQDHSLGIPMRSAVAANHHDARPDRTPAERKPVRRRSGENTSRVVPSGYLT